MEEELRLKAYLSLFTDRTGRRFIQIRKVITDLDLAHFLLSKILREGKVVVQVELSIKDPVRAMAILRMLEKTIAMQSTNKI